MIGDTSDHTIDLAGRSVSFTLKRSKRRTLGITVFPDGKVFAVAPISADIDRVEQKLRKRSSWILSTLREFERFRPRTPARTFDPGETHRFLGRQYRLKVMTGLRTQVDLHGDRLQVEYPQRRSSERTEEVLGRWYQQQAKKLLYERLQACLTRFLEVPSAPRLTVRKLTKRWGSMSSDGTHMLLNTRLVEAPVDCIDYVIIHELCHIAKPHHGASFFALLERKLPDWQRRKNRLERVMI